MKRKQKLLKALLNLKEMKQLGLVYLETRSTIDDYQKINDLIHIAITEDELIEKAIAFFEGENPYSSNLSDDQFNSLYEETGIEEELRQHGYLSIDEVIENIRFEIRHQS